LTFVEIGKKCWGRIKSGKAGGLSRRSPFRKNLKRRIFSLLGDPEKVGRSGSVRKRGKMETYPFHHRNLFFQICTDYDLTFKEIRGILDFLLEAQAFEEDRRTSEEGQLYELQVENVRYVVDVIGPNVVVYQREEG